ncbi:hypothetical protein IFM89_023955 [Coptis chinensis]|uniref:3-dehydroquinate synthase N-terminal domain-containing protein n=1 Tax=Coptis chinensis TaxID=261450 RepID=A0A835HLN7_9MAGN|nr:hypothetical protein IFM89_023955 [Coptis chinensis]
MSYIPTVCQSQPKLVWIWTTNRQVMTAAVERGWNTFIFTSQNRDLANEWSSIASIYPLFIEGEGLFDSENRKLAMFHKISSAKELNKLQAVDEEIKNVVLDLHWQVIPSETVVAALQDTQKAVFAISKTPSEAKILIEVFEQGLSGVVLKVEDVDAVHELKVIYLGVEGFHYSEALCLIMAAVIRTVLTEAAAASLCVQVKGAIPSMPKRKTVLDALQSL